MDNTNSSLFRLSLDTLGHRIWANCLIIIFSLSSLVSNCVLLAVIIKSKSLHTKCFVLIGVNGFVDGLLGIAYGITSTKRIYRYFQNTGEVMSKWDCFYEIWPNALLQLVSLSMAAALAVDRALAILSPIKYKQLSYRRFTLPVLLTAFLSALAQFLATFYSSYRTTPDAILFSCGVDDSVSDGMLIGVTSVQIVIAVVTVGLNCWLAVIMKKKQATVQPVNTTINAMSGDSKERRAFKTITATVLLHTIVNLGGRLFIICAPFTFNDMAQAMTFRYMRDLTVVSAAVNFYVLIVCSSEFRNATVKLITSSG